VEHLGGRMDRKPIIVAPYDAELFGHWWYEGPLWIDFLMRKLAFDQKTLRPVTPSQYLEEYPVNQVALPSASSWGYKGYSEYWCDGSNDWVYRYLHQAGRRMNELSQTLYAKTKKLSKTHPLRRGLDQAARELVLAESSDWPFIMKTGTMVPYAQKRVKMHVARFTKLYKDLKNNAVDEPWLTEVERRDTIFSGMDCAKYYLTKKKPLRREVFH
jgi:1,4-alpha-glucan branching enzyme